jgi:hypothetical protein
MSQDVWVRSTRSLTIIAAAMVAAMIAVAVTVAVVHGIQQRRLECEFRQAMNGYSADQAAAMCR